MRLYRAAVLLALLFLCAHAAEESYATGLLGSTVEALR